MKLYYSPGACSLAVHIVLRELQIPFDLESVDLSNHRTGEQDFYTVSPHGKVPLLVLDDGTRLSEGPAICQYLADHAARQDLLPPAGTLERFRVVEWQNFIATELHKSFAPFFNAAYPEANRPFMRATLHRLMEWVGERVGRADFLTGSTFTVADAYLFAVTGWADHAGVQLPHTLCEYRDRLRQRASVRAALHAEGLA